MIELTPEVEKECTEQIHREASYWSKRFPGRQVTRDDLIQEGWAATMRALQSYQPGQGTQVGTYVTTCLRNRFKDLLHTAQRRRAFHTEGLDGLMQNFRPVLTTQSQADAVAKLATLTVQEFEMAEWLSNAAGKVARVAREQGIPLALVNRFKQVLAEKLQ